MTKYVSDDLRKDIECACLELSALEDGTPVDYHLGKVAFMVDGELCQIDNTISRGGVEIEMDGSHWMEMGHQYSVLKQWWPCSENE
jgi:hypothetical protein